MKELISKLNAAPSGPGQEDRIREMIQELVTPYVTEVSTDVLGNLIAVKKPKTAGDGKTIMLVTHMDEPGVVVVDKDEQGWLRVEPLGNLKASDMIGARVVFGRTGIKGVIGVESHVEDKDIAFRHLFVDVGCAAEHKVQGVAIGDVATWSGPFEDLDDDIIVGHALDARAACAVLIEALKAAKSTHTIIAVFTAQHQVGSRGAKVAAYRIKPDLAIAVDVTPAGDTPKAEHISVELGKGPAIKALDGNVVVAPTLVRKIAAIAEKHGIAYQIEVAPKAKSEAGTTLISGEGVPTCGVSIGARYIGTPSCMVSLSDVTNTLTLIVGALTDGAIL